MTLKAMRPEDVLPDNQNHVATEGRSIRKGSMGAALMNANVIESDEASEEEKLKAKEILRELAPTLIDFGLTKFLTWKNPEIQAIFEKV